MTDDWYSDETPALPELIYHEPIPAILQSLEADGPFVKCNFCERQLAAADNELATTFMVERVFRGSEPIIEYAMCWNCRHGMSDGMSEESMQRVSAYFNEHVDLEARAMQLVDQYRHDSSETHWFDHCVITKQPRSEFENYQVIGMCSGSGVLLGLSESLL